MARQKLSCTNTRKELMRCCSPIGHNNTGASIDRLEMVRWESVPRGFSARTLKLSSTRLFSQPDWLPLGLRGWVDVRRSKKGLFTWARLTRLAAYRDEFLWHFSNINTSKLKLKTAAKLLHQLNKCFAFTSMGKTTEKKYSSSRQHN